MTKKTYVLDTNVYLTDSSALTSYGNNDILIPIKVLEEIDKHKKRQDSVGANARRIIRALDDLRAKGNLHKGVRIERGKGIVKARSFDPDILPPGYNSNDPDNQILSTALTEKQENPKRKIIVVSRDINMRVKCDALGLAGEDYVVEKLVESRSQIYTGVKNHLVDDQIIDRFYSGEPVTVEKEDVELYPHQFVMLISNSNEKKTALARFSSYTKPLSKIIDCFDNRFKIKARNKEQEFAFNLLFDPGVEVITLVGAAGTGKTLIALYAGICQTLDNFKGVLPKQAEYDRMIISRPIQPMGKDLGFLPGSLEEKMAPWLSPIKDNLQFLMGGKKDLLKEYVEEGIIEVEALTYIRGRSINNAFIIIDEIQNMTVHELKTVVTRVGEGSKIVLMGDVEQIDNVYLDETTNGLTYAVEKFKTHSITGHMTLKRGERSKVATLAAKIL
jgi:PhoH-like ATPase